MKREMLVAAATAVFFVATAAHADSLTEAQKAGLVSTDEAGDAWLHDHCSFRGAGDPGIRDAKIPGQVIELVDNGQSPLVKEFRCAEQPPGWKGPWTSAPADAVSCTETPTAPRCVPPLAKAAAPAVALPVAAAPPVEPPPRARAMIAPPHKPPPPRRMHGPARQPAKR